MCVCDNMPEYVAVSHTQFLPFTPICPPKTRPRFNPVINSGRMAAVVKEEMEGGGEEKRGEPGGGGSDGERRFNKDKGRGEEEEANGGVMIDGSPAAVGRQVFKVQRSSRGSAPFLQQDADRK